MRGWLLFFPAFLLCAPAHAEDKGSDKSVVIGPWKIEASYTKGKIFDRCTMSRTLDNGLEASFARDQGGTSLTMTSPRWKLDNGKTYPVNLAAGKVIWKTDVAATSDTVRVELTNARFNKAVKNVNRLEIRGAGATLTIPLDKSSAALARLEHCYATNRKASETNPFIAPQP